MFDHISKPLKNTPLRVVLGSLRNHDGDAEDNVDWKMNLYFTYESRDTLKSFAVFITVKTITKIKLKHSDKFEI